jgi:hypothetical protein
MRFGSDRKAVFLNGEAGSERTALVTNEDKLRRLYVETDASGVAFCAKPVPTPIYNLPHGDYTLSDRPVDEWVPWVVADYERHVAMQAAVGDDSVPIAKLTTCTHIYAAAFGSPIEHFEGQETNPCAVPFIKTAAEADKLEQPRVESSPTLSRVIELGQKVRDRLGPDAYLGPPAMLTGFDTACLIWDKTELYCAMMDDEGRQSVKRLAAKCAGLFKEYLTILRREFPRMSPLHCPGVWCPPELGPWMSNDECGAVSTEMFEAFMLPEMVDLAETFGGIGMHCCADAEHQFASFRKIPNFYSFNRVAARQGYSPLLDHLAGPGSPVHVLAWIGQEDVRTLLSLAPEGTRFIFQQFCDEADEARAWYDQMHALRPEMGRKTAGLDQP